MRKNLTLRTRLWDVTPKGVRSRIGAALVPLERWFNDRKCAQGLRTRWARVDDRVILGALPYPEHIAELKALGVGAVVNAMDEGAPIEAMCKKHGLAVLRLSIVNGDTPERAHLRQALAFIEEQTRDKKHSVYIHCNMGSGRSACIAFAWLRDVCNFTPKQAQMHLQGVRPQVHEDIWLRVPLLR